MRMQIHREQSESDFETPQCLNQMQDVNSNIAWRNIEEYQSNNDQPSSEKDTGILDPNFEQIISRDEEISSADESTDILEPLRNWVNAYGIKANAVDSLLKL